MADDYIDWNNIDLNDFADKDLPLGADLPKDVNFTASRTYQAPLVATLARRKPLEVLLPLPAWHTYWNQSFGGTCVGHGYAMAFAIRENKKRYPKASSIDFKKLGKFKQRVKTLFGPKNGAYRYPMTGLNYEPHVVSTTDISTGKTKVEESRSYYYEQKMTMYDPLWLYAKVVERENQWLRSKGIKFPNPSIKSDEFWQIGTGPQYAELFIQENRKLQKIAEKPGNIDKALKTDALFLSSKTKKRGYMLIGRGKNKIYVRYPGYDNHQKLLKLGEKNKQGVLKRRGTIPTVNNLKKNKRYTSRSSLDRSGQTGLNQMKHALRQGHAIALCSPWPKPWSSPIKNGSYWVVPDFNQSDVRGGHCYCIFGASDKKQAFAMKNSWGPGYGDAGVVWISYKNIQKLFKLYPNVWGSVI